MYANQRIVKKEKRALKQLHITHADRSTPRIVGENAQRQSLILHQLFANHRSVCSTSRACSRDTCLPCLVLARDYS